MADQLDPQAVERVLRRAHDLEGEADDSHPLAVDPEVLVESAGEVGIPALAVRQSLAVERLGVAPVPTRLDRLVGPALVTEDRFVDLDADEVVKRLDRWSTSALRLRLARRRPGHAEWTRRSGTGASVRRRMRRLNGGPALADVRALTAEVVAVDDTAVRKSSLVRVTADRSPERSAHLSAGLGMSTAGAVGSVAAVTIFAPPLLLVSVPALLWGLFTLRSDRAGAARARSDLTQLVDAVEDGESPSTVGSRVREHLTSKRRSRAPGVST
jgi:hypothetical protein